MKNFLKHGAKLSTALLLSLIVWEVLLRVFFTVPIVSDHVENLGWLPKNARGISTVEGRGHVAFNQYGFREGPLDKSQNETRVLILGDSNIEARQVNIENTMPARLQILLAKSQNCHVRVVNGGRVGATPAFHVALSDEYNKLFQPDWTVVLVEDDRWKLVFSHSHEMRYEPQGDAFKIVTKWQGESRGRAYHIMRQLHLRDLALFDWSYSRWQLMQGMGGTNEGAAERAAAKGAAQGNKTQRAAYANMRDKDAITRAMRWTLQQLKADYPRLVIVHMPSADAEASYIKPPGPEEFTLIELCKAYKIPLVLMRERVTSDYQKNHQPPFGFMNTLPWSGHINAHGHDLIAHALADYFEDKLCPETPVRGANP